MSDLVLLPGRRTAGLFGLDPAEVITVTFGGKTFRCGRRTYAHLLATQARLDKVRPGAKLRVIQPCYNTGVELSAYTHDGDGVLDVEIVGWDDWPAEQRFLRSCGWADWWRHTGTWAAVSRWHHHMVSLGCPGPVGLYVPGQVLDYYAGALGLKGQHDSGSDPSWPAGDDAKIAATIFDYPAWLRAQEDLMGWNDWTDKDRDDAAKAIAAAVAPVVVRQLLAAFVDNGKTTVRAALRKAAGTGDLVRQLGQRSRPSVVVDDDPTDEQ